MTTTTIPTAPRFEVLAEGGPTVNGHRLSAPGKPWKYTKTPEFLLYLLLHPAGASQDRIMEALFPGEPAQPQRLNLLASDARTKIAGPDILPAASPNDPYYRLTDGFGFDLRDLAIHCARADHTTTNQDRVQHLTQALELVRGRPFDLPANGYGWALVDIETAIIKIEDTALALADLASATGDHNLAIWATTRALTTGTGNQDLLIARGRSALAAANPAEIIRAFANLHTALGAEPGENLDWVDNDLADVIGDLDRYRRQRLGARVA